MSTKIKNRPNTENMKKLDFEFVGKPVVTKAADGAVYIEGYANTIDKDRVKDIVLPEAFAESLPMYMKNPVLLFQHNWDNVIGKVVDAKITEKGLWIKALLSAAGDCSDVRTKIVEGILKTFSIGYNEIEAIFNEPEETKIIKKLELLEISVVTIPANPEATFTVSTGGGAAPAAPTQASAQLSEAVKALHGVVESLASQVGTIGEAVKTLMGTKGNDMSVKVKNGEGAAQGATAPAAAGKADGGAAPAAPAAGEGKPEGAPAEGDKPAGDLGKVLEMLTTIGAGLSKLTESVGKVEAAAAQILAAVQAGKADGEKPEGEGEPEVCSGCGKPKAECVCEPGKAAPAAGATKSLEEMSDEEVEAELEQVSKELEGLTD